MKKAIVIIAVLVLAVIGYKIYHYSKSDRTNSSNEQVVCTADVFMCPEGSYVGRTGASCEFSACPNQEFFIGILRQDPSGFALILPSPTSSGEVDYRMPLILKVTNVIGSFVGQKVKVYGNFTKGATFAVDHVEELPGDAGDATLGELSVGETKFINGVRITLNKIVQDSRCPINAQCIRAGDVTVNVTLQSDTDKETVDILSTASASLDSFHVSIVNIKPSRSSTVAPPAESYLITFKVQ